MLELLMVVAVIAVVAGGLIYSQGDTHETAQLSVAQAEMSEIRAAIDRFKLDNVITPSPANPADFSYLLERGVLGTWNSYVSRGWRGPYLRLLGEGYVDVGDDLSSSGSGSPALVDSTPHQAVRGIADPFVRVPVASDTDYVPCSESASDSSCLLDWRIQPADARHERWGRPYFGFDLDDPARSRIVSSGPNGRYESQACASTDCAACSPGGDDLVVCLSN
jgi:type II secretory pathway pseudopilin PulG